MKIYKNDILTLVGFVLFILGMMAVFLSLVGVHFSFLNFLERWSGLASFLFKLGMAILGLILVYIAKTQNSNT